MIEGLNGTICDCEKIGGRDAPARISEPVVFIGLRVRCNCIHVHMTSKREATGLGVEGLDRWQTMNQNWAYLVARRGTYEVTNLQLPR